jgi:deleted-in-malignant-brain-tumors protein 1
MRTSNSLCNCYFVACTQGAIRLQGGANNMTGRVEICNANVWGTVCDDFWGAADAQVACRQLGFSATGMN